MRTFFAFAFALLATAATAQSVPDQTPDGLVRYVYQQYVGKGAGEDVNFNWMDKPLVDQLFEPALAAAIVKDFEDAEQSELGGDPFINAQDYDVKSADVSIASTTGESARVVAKIVNFGEPVEFTYLLVKAGNGWRIRDIIWGGEEPSTLRKALKVP